MMGINANDENQPRIAGHPSTQNLQEQIEVFVAVQDEYTKKSI